MVEEAKDAESSCDTQKLYQTLGRIGARDTQTIEDSAQALMNSAHTSWKCPSTDTKCPQKEIEAAAVETQVRTDEAAKSAAKRLEEEITPTEFNEEIERINRGAPGNDGIRMEGIKSLSNNAKSVIYICVMNLLEMDPAKWPIEC